MTKKLYTASDARRLASLENSIPSDEEPYRSPWRRDYARLIHSAAFRRLQGKTQLFPGRDSDFFRNRLTHSLEVAQVAKSIAIRINNTHDYFKSHGIDTDLVETAALAHDLGHPPFGHNGEEALNECMKGSGGFEGNAQTLRILSKLEKRQTKTYLDNDVPVVVSEDGKDNRVGLNLAFRTLAAVLKYDEEIPATRTKAGVAKGYYYTEAEVVSQIKKNVSSPAGAPFKTIECSIMDVADDIAYSTYDLEDAFKAEFLSPTSVLAVDGLLLGKVSETITERLQSSYKKLKAYRGRPSTDFEFSTKQVYETLAEIFSGVWGTGSEFLDDFSKGKLGHSEVSVLVTSYAEIASRKMATDGYYRSKLTSDFVGNFIRGVEVEFNDKNPALSKAYLNIEVFKKVEVLKNLAFQALIMSPRLKVAEYRGKDIVRSIFKAISEDEGYLLMPNDFQDLYRRLTDPALKKRVVCDFIAGMTDRYAIQFYGRLYGTNPETIYSPL